MDEIKTFKEKEALFKERTGNEFTFYYTKYYSKLIYYITKICNDPQKAEDIAIESFMTSIDKIDTYHKEKSQFSTWLFTIGRNKILQDMKINKVNISIDMEFDNEGTTLKDFIKDTDDSVATLMDINIKKGQIMKQHIANLKPSYKMVMEMREFDAMTYDEISKKLNVNLNTIKSRIKNGRELLIKSTKKEFDTLDNMYL